MNKNNNWQIVYYHDPNGDEPVFDFIESLSPVAQAKVSNSLDLLSLYGIQIGLPHVKKVVGTDLWELRILGGDNIRIFYIASTGRKFVLLHGFIKKSQKTNSREIKIANLRLKKYLQPYS